MKSNEDIGVYHYLKTANEIKDIKDVNKDLLMLFSVYISLNKDYKYNRTYLTDSIDPFLESVNTLIMKRGKVEEIILKLNKCTKPFLDSEKQNHSFSECLIIVDNFFSIECNNDIWEKHNLVDNMDCGTMFREYIDKFNLFAINKDYLEIRVINIKTNKNLVKTYKVDEYIEFIQLFNLLALIRRG